MSSVKLTITIYLTLLVTFVNGNERMLTKNASKYLNQCLKTYIANFNITNKKGLNSSLLTYIKHNNKYIYIGPPEVRLHKKHQWQSFKTIKSYKPGPLQFDVLLIFNFLTI